MSHDKLGCCLQVGQSVANMDLKAWASGAAIDKNIIIKWWFNGDLSMINPWLMVINGNLPSGYD